MITMSYECPETHKPLPRMSGVAWKASDDSTLVLIHCPRCSGRHTFSRADAILSFDVPARKKQGPLMVVGGPEAHRAP